MEDAFRYLIYIKKKTSYMVIKIEATFVTLKNNYVFLACLTELT